MDRIAQLKLAHDSAMQMVSSQAGTFWSTITSMVAANTLIALGAAAISQLQADEWGQWPLAIGAVFGLAVCTIWFFMVRRQFAYFGFWIQFARDLQRELLHDVPQLLVLGDNYGQGSSVSLPGGTNLAMSRSARALRIQTLVAIMVAVFALLFAGLLSVALVGIWSDVVVDSPASDLTLTR